MTIFQMMVFACYISGMTATGHPAKVCNWYAHKVYPSEQRCKAAGPGEIGKLADNGEGGKYPIEQYRCDSKSVEN